MTAPGRLLALPRPTSNCHAPSITTLVRSYPSARNAFSRIKFSRPTGTFGGAPHFRKGSIDLLHRTRCAIVPPIQSARVEIMSKNNTETWNPKYGKRRVRQEKPTLAEAIEAAKGFIEDLDQQAEFSAAL